MRIESSGGSLHCINRARGVRDDTMLCWIWGEVCSMSETRTSFERRSIKWHERRVHKTPSPRAYFFASFCVFSSHQRHWIHMEMAAPASAFHFENMDEVQYNEGDHSAVVIYITQGRCSGLDVVVLPFKEDSFTRSVFVLKSSSRMWRTQTVFNPDNIRILITS